jgi:hypothetical protein
MGRGLYDSSYAGTSMIKHSLGLKPLVANDEHPVGLNCSSWKIPWDYEVIRLVLKHINLYLTVQELLSVVVCPSTYLIGEPRRGWR